MMRFTILNYSFQILSGYGEIFNYLRVFYSQKSAA